MNGGFKKVNGGSTLLFSVNKLLLLVEEASMYYNFFGKSKCMLEANSKIAFLIFFFSPQISAMAGTLPK